jgi:hypothetical protein
MIPATGTDRAAKEAAGHTDRGENSDPRVEPESRRTLTAATKATIRQNMKIEWKDPGKLPNTDESCSGSVSDQERVS